MRRWTSYGGYKALLLMLAASFAIPCQAQLGDPGEKDEFKDQLRLLTLESFEIVGTVRMDRVTVERELGIVPGIVLDGDFVWKTRQRLLGLGIFRSVLLYMKKGKKPHTAHLVIECEDDPGVLGAWAMGAMARVSYDDSANRNDISGDTPVDFQLEVVGRNIARRLYRGELGLGLDTGGSIDQAHIAFGSPRFSDNDQQIDAEFTVNGVRQRYFDCMGFCAGASALVSRDAGDYSWWSLGLAMLHNEGSKYAMPGFPARVDGPQVSLVKDTRLKGFVLGDGYRYGASATLSAERPVESVVQANIAYTLSLHDLLSVTFDGAALWVGVRGASGRLGGLIDIPLYKEQRSIKDHAKLYVKWQAGADRYEGENLKGSATTVGIRCHRFGLIADIALKVTMLPQELFHPSPQRMGVPLD